jgi:hypothetical protein
MEAPASLEFWVPAIQFAEYAVSRCDDIRRVENGFAPNLKVLMEHPPAHLHFVSSSQPAVASPSHWYGCSSFGIDVDAGGRALQDMDLYHSSDAPVVLVYPYEKGWALWVTGQRRMAHLLKWQALSWLTYLRTVSASKKRETSTGDSRHISRVRGRPVINSPLMETKKGLFGLYFLSGANGSHCAKAARSRFDARSYATHRSA